MRLVFLGAVLVVMVGMPALGQSIKGYSDCGQWVKGRPNSVPTDGAYLAQMWVLGYLSGLSVGQKLEFWVRPDGEISADQVMLWMDKYCEANPLKDIENGAEVLFNEVTLK